MSQDIDRILSVLQDASSDGFEGLSSYEEEQAYEVENYLVRARNIPRVQARPMARKIAANPVALAAIAGSMGANAGRGAMTITAGNDTPVSAAQFDIKVTRNSANIAQVLPICLFGTQDAMNGYRSILGNLPTNVSLTSVRYGENNSQPNALRFTFTQSGGGDPVDTIDVTCNQYPYPAFITSQQTDLLKLSKLRYSISDTAQLTQFSQEHKFIQAGMFGTLKQNSLSIGAYKSPDQYQAGIIDIDGVFEVDKETSLRMGIINVASFSVTLSMFVEKFYRQTAKGF